MSNLRKRLRRCHELLESAYGAIDPDANPHISASIDRELRPCTARCPTSAQWDLAMDVVDAALDVFRDPGDKKLPHLDDCAYLKLSGIRKLYAAVNVYNNNRSV